MTTDDYFRLALVLLLVITLPIGAYHRIQAAASGEKISRKEEGYLFATILRLSGLILFIFTFLYLVFPGAISALQLPLPLWLRSVGVVISFLCPLLLYWTLSNLGKNLTDTVMVRSGATLVTTGPYRFVRHPFYVAAALLIVSVSLLTAHWTIALSGALVLLLLAVRTPKEEQMLLQRFGSEYADYMERTGRFFPRPARIAKPHL